MTTPPTDARDGAQVPQEDAMARARDLVLAYDMACDAHSKAHRLYLCGDGKQACADKAQQTEEAMHAAREDLIAALATPPAPDRTLAELVDAYGEAMREFDAANEAWRSLHSRERFAVREDARERTNTTYAALLAYQPPAPVSRAGAVSDEMYNRACEAYQAFDPEESINFAGMHAALTAALAAAEGSDMVSFSRDEVSSFRFAVELARDACLRHPDEFDEKALRELEGWIRCLTIKDESLAAAEGRA